MLFPKKPELTADMPAETAHLTNIKKALDFCVRHACDLFFASP